jgi:hypothetical protein
VSFFENVRMLSTRNQSSAKTDGFVSHILNWWVWFDAASPGTSFVHLKDLLWRTPWKQWHHLVEQWWANIAKFWSKNIHHTHNVIELPAEVHRKITKHYARKFTDELDGWKEYSHYRDYVKTLNYDKQREIWIETMVELGLQDFIK